MIMIIKTELCFLKNGKNEREKKKAKRSFYVSFFLKKQ